MSWLAIAVIGWVGAAGAGPRDDLTAWRIDRWCRLEEADALLGAPDRSHLALGWRLRGAGDRFSADLGPELAAARGESSWSDPALAVVPGGRVGAGLWEPYNLGGDQERGWTSLRASLDAIFYPGIFEFTAAPELGVDLAIPAGLEFDPIMALRDAWGGVRIPAGPHGQVSAGAGVRDRWIGPGRFGSLLLSDNARPAPAATLAWEGRAGGVEALHARAEAGAGWLDGERGDVEHPGWLFMDFRWLPLPLLEVGLGRVGLFGGEGRPTPDIGQLIVPTDPHVYDDPDQDEPDQDEIAALDFRLLLPVGRWAGVGSSRGRRVDGIDYVELWWQYGGEDVIARRTAGIPYPALAGVANLYGAEVSAGPLVVTWEQARLLDDYFRWYVGHRVYHDGFVRDGQVMGHHVGGDAIDHQVAVAWMEDRVGLEVGYERLRRVGVIETLGENLLALKVDERSDRWSVRGWRRAGSDRWWTAGATVERQQGTNFVPGDEAWSWRLFVGG